MPKKYATETERHEAVLATKRKSFRKAELRKWKISFPEKGTYEEIEVIYNKECVKFHEEPDILHEVLEKMKDKRENNSEYQGGSAWKF